MVLLGFEPGSPRSQPLSQFCSDILWLVCKDLRLFTWKHYRLIVDYTCSQFDRVSLWFHGFVTLIICTLSVFKVCALCLPSPWISWKFPCWILFAWKPLKPRLPWQHSKPNFFFSFCFFFMGSHDFEDMFVFYPAFL